ncbi:MAG: class I SAM-dependent methyltransferase [Pyrinomonadaceae bacterium]
MSTNKPLFGKDQAENYDEQWSRLFPVNDLLHFLTKLILKGLPSDARVLCVGAGTGAELVALAAEFPEWRFTAIDTSPEMIKACRRKAERAGFSDRCEFYSGTIGSFPEKGTFDAATSILVSQFLTEQDERTGFFAEIRKRLKPGGYLINADLTSPDDGNSYQELLKVWKNMLIYAGTPKEKAEASASQWGKMVAVSKQHKIEEMISSAGFLAPTLFYQSLFIKAWFAKT